MPITLQLPDDFPTSPVVTPVGDAAGHVLLTVIHQASTATEVAYGAVYLAPADWSSVTLIGRSEPHGKDAGAYARVRPGTTPPRQTVELVVTEAMPGGPGSSSQVHIYTFPDAVPAALSQVGPAGPRGPAGPPGPQGPAGASGTDAVKTLAADLVVTLGRHD